MSESLKSIRMMILVLGSLALLSSACSNVEFAPTNPAEAQKQSPATPPAQQGADPVVVAPPPEPVPPAPQPVDPPPPVPQPPVVVVPPPAPPQPPPPACVPVASITRLTKILFLVDTSGSNNSYVDSRTGNNCSNINSPFCVKPTDWDKKFRLGSIRSFVNKYDKKKNFQWGFITFAEVSAQDFVGKGGKLSFTASSDVMKKAIDNFAKQYDGGDTPYGVALTAAANAVANDPDHNSVLDPQYFVVMLTDGYPTDFQKPTDASTFVNKLLSAAPGEVSLSTIFYGPQNYQSSVAAISMLQGMAKLGSGQFANVNNPKSGINIDDVIPGKDCP